MIKDVDIGDLTDEQRALKEMVDSLMKKTGVKQLIIIVGSQSNPNQTMIQSVGVNALGAFQMLGQGRKLLGGQIVEMIERDLRDDESDEKQSPGGDGRSEYPS